MPWKDLSSGGPWGNPGGGDGGRPRGPRGPWGGPPGGGSNGSGNGGGRGPFQAPKFEDLLRKGGDRFKGMMPGGVGSPRGIALVGLAAVLIWLLTGFYTVRTSEAGVETIFGRMTGLTGEGLHWNWPSPIGGVLKPEVTGVRQTSIGLAIVPGTGRGPVRAADRESLMLTGDENIIDVQAVVSWRVDWEARARQGAPPQASEGIRQFVFNIRNAPKTVEDVAESALREIVGRREFENIRTTGRGEIEQEAARLIQQMLDQYGSGIRVTIVQLQKIDPPTKALDAFRDVQAARADKERAINNAQGYTNQVVQRAEGEAEKVVRAAEAYRQERIARAEGDASRFLALFKEYSESKDITRQRIYLETMRDLLKGMDKVLLDNRQGSGVVPYLPLDQLRPPAVRPPATGETRPGDTRTGGN
jgi:membrane protease subunit HflK